MKFSAVLIVFLAFSFFSAKGSAFSMMTCKKVISDEYEVAVTAKGVNFTWTSRGGDDVVALLRTVADPRIPTSLLEAYGHLLITFTIPVDSCEFSTETKGKFACRFEGNTKQEIPFQINARLSPYENKPFDEYRGALAKLSVESNFSGKKGSRYLEFPMHFTVAGATPVEVEAVSDFFFAHYWSSEGFKQNPSCLVDNGYLVENN